jgi:hypothetical protein
MRNFLQYQYFHWKNRIVHFKLSQPMCSNLFYHKLHELNKMQSQTHYHRLSLSRTEYWIYVLQQTLSKNSKLTQTETHKSIPKNPTNWNPEIKRNGMLIPYWTQTQVAFSERGCNQRRNQRLQSQKSNEINTQRFGDHRNRFGMVWFWF